MPSLFDQHFARGNEALDRRDYHEADEAFEAALAAAGAPHERALALDAAADICSVHGQYDRALATLEEAITLCLPKPGDSTPMEGRAAHALALVSLNRGLAFIAVKRDDEALVAFDTSLDLLLDHVGGDGSAVPALPRLLTRTLSTKAITLERLDRDRDALACYEEMIRRFEQAGDVVVMNRIAGATLRRAKVLGKLGRQDQEIAGCDALVARYGDIESVELKRTVFETLEWKLLTYRDQGDYEQVVEACDDIIRRYASESDREIASGVARTMVRKAGAFHELDRPADEIDCLDQVASRYGAAEEPWLRAHAANALMFKAITLNESGQTADEMECYEQIIERYAGDDDDKVRSVAAQALVNKGISLGAIADDAAEDTGVRETEAEIACYDEAIARYGDADFLGLQQVVAEALLYKGITLLEAGQTAEAAACLNAVVEGYDQVEDAELEKIVMDARELRAEI